MGQKIIYGVISAEGDKISGSGFKVERPSQGKYVIEFKDKFDSIPSVVVTFIGSEEGGKASDNIANVSSSESECTILSLDLPQGLLQNSAFNFIAVGKD